MDLKTTSLEREDAASCENGRWDLKDLGLRF